MVRFSLLWRAPELNPETLKATSVPLLNPLNIYGRCFHFAWLGFFVAFLSWFAFPPLMADITKDLKLTPAQVSNSNIVGLCSTLIARFVLGPLCDRFGPRLMMAAVLFVGAVPTAFVPLVSNVSGLYAIRFFIGLLGGAFIPCQMWTTTFFDKAIVGRTNALVAGWGNAGGGVAFFTMPAVMNALHRDGYSMRHSWKYSFTIYPFVVIMLVASLALIFGQDCPEGKWSQRASSVTVLEAARQHPLTAEQEAKKIDSNQSPNESASGKMDFNADPEKHAPTSDSASDVSIGVTYGHGRDIIIENPTFWDTCKVAASPSTMLNALPYATTFGGELAVEAIISALYSAHALKKGEHWSTQLAGDWGAMLGLLNVVTRPLGGYISDKLYERWQTTQVKKFWLLTCGFLEGVFLLYIGLYKSVSMAGLIASVAILCLFMEMGNGAVFSLVPHVNPHHTGIVAGTVGSFGNVGGILFSLAFRFTLLPSGKTDYQAAMWQIGIAIMGVNALCTLIPLPKSTSY